MAQNLSPDISVIIISYNTKPTTLACLKALYSGLGNVIADVWVVDNASTDGSVEEISKSFPQVHMIENDHNLGFGAANNQAMERAQGRFFLLLNSDAFLEPGAAAALIQYLVNHPNVGVVGPQLLNIDGSPQMSWHRFPSPSHEWQNRLWISTIRERLFSSPKETVEQIRVHNNDYVNGACMLISRLAYEQVGGFDERFFMYYEEADWHRRFLDHGWKLAYLPLAKAVHIHGASSSNKMWIFRHYYDALDYYIWKHFGVTGLISVRVAVFLGAILNLVAYLPQNILLRRKNHSISLKIRLHSYLLVREVTKWNIHPEKRPA